MEATMGNLVVTEFVTVDGVFDDPGGAEGTDHGGWAFTFDRGPEGDKFKFEELEAADVQLLGRVTYEGFAKAWPNMQADEFGQKMNSMPKYVVSMSLERADWNNSTIIRGDVAAEVRKLKQQVDGDILVAGSGTLVALLIEDDLVDEFRLMVFPVLLGSGKRLFPQSRQVTNLRLADSQPAGDCLILIYRPASDAD
jgi:dihydrofolate reductase